MSFPTEAHGSDEQPLHARSAGSLALQRLSGGGKGRTVANFAHSLYIRLATGSFVCIGTQAIGAGPLNVLLTHGDWLRLHPVAVGDPVATSASALVFADRHRVTWTRAVLWRPRAVSLPHNIVATHLRVLSALAPRLAPDVGLSRLAFAPHSGNGDPVLSYAEPGWDGLERWAARCMAEPMAPAPDRSMSRMIGLGPGLTPSGDDVFCGVLIALGALGLDAARASLWSWLRPQLSARTSALSAAHLGAAALGQGHSALHAILACAAPDRFAVEASLLRLGQVGHCSGWDALAGVVAVWRAFVTHDAISRTASSAACAFDGATVTPARSNVRDCAE